MTGFGATNQESHLRKKNPQVILADNGSRKRQTAHQTFKFQARNPSSLQ